MPAWPVAVHWPLSALEHGAFVLAGLLIYLTSTRLTRQHRHPSAALAWVMTMVLLPYIGIPLYLLIGVRKEARPRSRAANRHAASQPSFGLSHWTIDLGHALALPAPTRNEHVVFHDDGHAALAHLHALIAQAERSVDVCTFVLGGDAVALRLSQALCEARERGVQVRVLLDAIGCWRTPPALVRMLREKGIQVQFFMPVLANLRRGRINLRNHRKLLIIDERHVWSGGRNLAAEYFTGPPGGTAWQDLSITITGTAARQARDLYGHDWRLAGGEQAFCDADVRAASDPTGARWLQWIPSGPDHAEDTLYALLLAAAYRAEQRITLVTPYFVPDDALLTAWCMACRRGVRLTLILPARSNHRLADLARAPALRALLAAGADVRLHPGMLHAKAILVDDDVAWVGSANLDSRSLFLNFELNLACLDAKSVAWLSDWTGRLAAHSTPERLRPPHVARELLEGLVRIVGFQL